MTTKQKNEKSNQRKEDGTPERQLFTESDLKSMQLSDDYLDRITPSNYGIPTGVGKFSLIRSKRNILIDF